MLENKVSANEYTAKNSSLYSYMVGFALLIFTCTALSHYLERLFNFSLSYFNLLITFIISYLISEIYYKIHQRRLNKPQIKQLAIEGNLALFILFPVFFGILWITYYSEQDKEAYLETLQKPMWLVFISLLLIGGCLFNMFLTYFALSVYNAKNTRKQNISSRERLLVGVVIAIFVIILFWGFLHFGTPFFNPYSK